MRTDKSVPTTSWVDWISMPERRKTCVNLQLAGKRRFSSSNKKKTRNRNRKTRVCLFASFYFLSFLGSLSRSWWVRSFVIAARTHIPEQISLLYFCFRGRKKNYSIYYNNQALETRREFFFSSCLIKRGSFHFSLISATSPVGCNKSFVSVVFFCFREQKRGIDQISVIYTHLSALKQVLNLVSQNDGISRRMIFALITGEKKKNKTTKWILGVEEPKKTS